MTHLLHTRRWGTLLIALLALTLLVSACSDDDTDDASSGDSTTATTDGETTTDGDADSSDSSGQLLALDDLTSYRYRMSMTTEADTSESTGAGFALNISVESEGAFVAPDRSSSSTVMDLGLLALEVETITIGSQTWTSTDGGPWEENGSDALGGLGDFDVDITPTLFLGGDDGDAETSLRQLSERLASIDGTPDTVNGIKATRYELDAKAFADILGEDSDALSGVDDTGTTTMWIADDTRFPIRIELNSETTQDGNVTTVKITMEFFDLNSDDISIEPPA